MKWFYFFRLLSEGAVVDTLRWQSRPDRAGIDMEGETPWLHATTRKESPVYRSAASS